MNRLEKRLKDGEVVILDGAIGSELQLMGVPMDGEAWCGIALKTHPDTVRQLHEDYIDAGADIITTNTYASAPHVLETVGLGDQAKELNNRAVQLAQDAIENAAKDRPVWVAGSLSSFGVYKISRGDRARPHDDLVEASYRKQAETLALAGVDLLVLEMVREPEQGGMLLTAALEIGLPVWVGFSCKVGRDGSTRMLSTDAMSGESDLDFADTLDRLMSRAGAVVAVMHTDVEDTTPALKVALEKWGGPVAAYSNAGYYWKVPDPPLDRGVSPKDYLSQAKGWVDLGVQIIGGCCGIGRRHIQALKQGLPSHIPPDARR